MSLINQMLRDLDARRGPASNVETAALQGMGLADRHDDEQRIVLRRAGWGIGLILAGLLIQQAYQAWSQQRASQEPVVTTPMMLPAIPKQTTEPVHSTPVITLPVPLPEKTSPTHSSPESQPAIVTEAYTLPPATENTVQAAVETSLPRFVKKTRTPAQIALRRFDRAQSLLTTGQIRAAADELLAALELDPTLVEARLQLSTLYLHKGRTDRARQLLDEGHRISSDNIEIAISYSRLLADQGEYLRALKILDVGLQSRTAGADTLALAASLHYKLKQFSASSTRYREALAQRPEQAVWWMGLGLSLEHDQRSGEALAAYRRANEASLDTALKDFINGRITALSGWTD